MVAQDLTKLTVVLVLLGGILAIAVFRPQILPSATNEPDDEMAQVEESDLGQRSGGEGSDPPQDLPALQEEVDQRQAELDEREAELGQDQAGLEERKAELNRRQAELDERGTELDQRQAALDERKAELDQHQARLDEREAKLEEQATSMQAWEERLINQNSLLDEDDARLRKKETDLAKREQKAQGFRRWSVTALVVAGLLAVPSVLVLVALMRQGQRTPDKEVQQAQAPQTRRRERVTQHGGLATVVPAPIHGGNGQNKERVEHYL
jgi:DNA repair exonuclease SbcCD ATPase subunit